MRKDRVEQLTQGPIIHTNCQKGEPMEEVLSLAMNAGRILLKNGAEVPRVEETILRICGNFGIQKVDVFVLSNGIFLTAQNDEQELFAQVKSVPLSGTHLGIVSEVNHLSREIEKGNLSLQEAKMRLVSIEKMPPNPNWFRIIASGIGSSCFIMMIGAGLYEGLFTLLSSSLLLAGMIAVEKKGFSKILLNIVGGAFITVMALLYIRLFPQLHLQMHYIIVGSIFPLVPGVGFVNAIRDVAESDFISGIVRFLDAVFVFVYIATGVGTVLSVYQNFLGRGF